MWQKSACDLALISFARQIGRARERLSNAIIALVRELRP